MLGFTRDPFYRLVCLVVVVMGLVVAIYGYSAAWNTRGKQYGENDWIDLRQSRTVLDEHHEIGRYGLITCVLGLSGLAAPFVIGRGDKPPED